jgi:bleomycin resistance family protein
MMPNTLMTWNVAPYFIVDDVVAAANFYRDKLGFDYERFWGDPPCVCMVKTQRHHHHA